tara:strand:- start:32516 stop:35629 length:3114 start_codon:yes stop_codon:yes gene_type:complete
MMMCVSGLITATHAQEARIPLENVRQPSRDLLFNGQVLTSEQAWRMAQDENIKLDLSALDPKPSSIYNTEVKNQNDIININGEEEYDFMAAIASHSGLQRFNVLSGNKENVYTIHLDKTLHTYLLRKNLLRKLGFVIPAMKWMPKLKVRFATIEERNKFLERAIPESTFGTAKRWIGVFPSDLKDDQLELEFQDVVVTAPNEYDHYNPSVMIPPRRLTTRTLRSLIVPYALLDLKESVNKFEWTVGRVDNDELVLPHFTQSNFDASMDDLLWMGRKLAKLKRSDFVEIVKDSHFPIEVEKLVLEKILSRKNTLLEILKIEHTEEEVNTNVNHGDFLVKGKLKKEDWDGYATRFAHGDPESPFKDIGYFLLAKLQSATIDNLIGKANEYLSAYDPNDVKTEFHNDQFQEGLEHFTETGTFKEFNVDGWVSPIVDGNLILSRDIVVGNYLGTDNLVQLADTIGYGVTLGAHIGIENVDWWPSAFLRANLSYVKSFTHLKPVRSLKASFKEPYKNMYVPLLKRNIKKELKKLTKLANQEGEVDEEEKNKLLAEIIEVINENLGVGESLIMTSRIVPSALLSGRLFVYDTSVSLGVGTDKVFLKRMHFYRKDTDTIQIYDDKGNAFSLKMNAGIDNKIPIVRLELKDTKGKYEVNVHNVNINTDEEKNPKFYEYATALLSLMSDDSTELLESIERPIKIGSNFHDKSTKLSFLMWRSKYLRKQSRLNIENQKGQKSELISVTHDGQSGINYESFAKDIVNFYLGKYLREEEIDINISLNPERWKNPAHTFKGVAETYSGRYEAQVTRTNNVEKAKRAFIGLTWKREGWSASRNKMKKLIKKTNEKFEQVIFDERTVNDLDKLSLYEITVNTNLYESGIQRVKEISEDEIKKIQRKYITNRRNTPDCRVRRSRAHQMRTAQTLIECGNLNLLSRKVEECRDTNANGKASLEDKGKCYLDLAAKLYQYLEFKDFKEIIGLDNMFVYGSINGFRKNSEILNNPIQSQTIGKVRARYWNGPIDVIREILNVQGGELHGSWIRESL